MRALPALSLIVLLPVAANGCSLVVDIDECKNNAQCVMEDGTQLVCDENKECVDPPGIGEECVIARECLEPLTCVAADPAQPTGFCTRDCTVQSCDDPAVPAGWICCELDNGTFACLAPAVCPG